MSDSMFGVDKFANPSKRSPDLTSVVHLPQMNAGDI